MAARFPCEPLNQRSIEQPGENRNDEYEPDAEGRKVSTRGVPELTVGPVTCEHPREEVDEVAKHRRAESGPGADDQRHDHEPEPRPGEPVQRPPEHRMSVRHPGPVIR